MTLDLRRLSPVFVASAIGLAGCGSSEGAADQLETFDITAKVTVDGQPLGGVQLTMAPANPQSGIPNSGAALGPDGTGKFSTYAPEDGIPAGEYTAGLLPDALMMKSVPQVKPKTVTTSADLDGGELAIAFESTGKEQKSILPPP